MTMTMTVPDHRSNFGHPCQVNATGACVIGDDEPAVADDQGDVYRSVRGPALTGSAFPR